MRRRREGEDPRKIRQRFVLECKDSERNLGLLPVALIDPEIEFVLVGVSITFLDTRYISQRSNLNDRFFN